MTLKDDIKVLQWVQSAFSAAGVELRDLSMKKDGEGYSLHIEVYADPLQLQNSLELTEPRDKKIAPVETVAKTLEQKPVVKISKPQEESVLDVFNLQEASVKPPDNTVLEADEGKKKKTTKKEREALEVTVEPLTVEIDEVALNRMFA